MHFFVYVSNGLCPPRKTCGDRLTRRYADHPEMQPRRKPPQSLQGCVRSSTNVGCLQGQIFRAVECPRHRLYHSAYLHIFVGPRQTNTPGEKFFRRLLVTLSGIIISTHRYTPRWRLFAHFQSADTFLGGIYPLIPQNDLAINSCRH